MSVEGPKMWLVAFVAVLFVTPRTIHSSGTNADITHKLCTEKEYYHDRKKVTYRPCPREETFTEKLKACGQVLSSESFNGQSAQILNPFEEEMYAELKRSNFYAKYQPDNTTVFENPYVRLEIVARENVLVNFVTTTREHFLREFAVTCIVRGTEEPHYFQQFFLSPNEKYEEGCPRLYKRCDKRYVFVYNEQGRIVVHSKVEYKL